MKRTGWQMWAALTGLFLLFAVMALGHVSKARTAGGSAAGQQLIAFGWFVFGARCALRSYRGFLAERDRVDRSRRTTTMTVDGARTLRFDIDLVGYRVDHLGAGAGLAFVAIGNALAHTSAGAVLAWVFGAYAWMLVVVGLRSFRFPPKLVVTSRGLECAFMLSPLVASWDDIASIRSTGNPRSVGWVGITLTTSFLENAAPAVRRRMERLHRRKGVHYRWADSFCYTSAAEAAAIIEELRSDPEVRAAMANDAVAVAPGAFASVDDAWTSGSAEYERAIRRAGIVALLGAGMRVIAYFMPWVIADRGMSTVYISGSHVGASVFSIWFSLGAAAIAISFVQRRTFATPGLLAGIGAGGMLASLININGVFAAMHQAQPTLSGTGVSLSLGPGSFVQLGGATIILAGGIMAALASRRRNRIVHTPPDPPVGAVAIGSTGALPPPPPRPADPVGPASNAHVHTNPGDDHLGSSSDGTPNRSMPDDV